MKSFALIWFLISSAVCFAAPPEQGEFNLELACKAINDAPSWTRMSEDTIDSAGPELTAVLKNYAKISPVEARKLVERLSDLSKDISKGAAIDHDICGKIYVFNRIYCNVPEMVDRIDWKFFGGWGGIPGDELRLNALYPLTQGEGGSLDLTETSGGYYGPPYKGLEEFDFLLSRFGKREGKKSEVEIPKNH